MPRLPCSIRTTITARIILKGLKDGLGAKAASMIVAEESYETTEPTIEIAHRQAGNRSAPMCSSTSPRRNSPRQAIKEDG